MALKDLHSVCKPCRKNGKGSDPCTLGLACKMCEMVDIQVKTEPDENELKISRVGGIDY